MSVSLQGGGVLRVYCVYRSPSADANVFLVELSKFLESNIKNNKNKDIILCGDLNIDFLGRSFERNELIDLLAAYGFECHIDSPTRHATASSTAIDYICTNFSTTEQKAIIDFNGLSDHSSQMLEVRVSSFAENNPKFAYKRFFNEQNYNTLFSYLHNETWLSVYEAHDVNAAFRVFSELLIYYIYRFSYKKSMPD